VFKTLDHLQHDVTKVFLKPSDGTLYTTFFSLLFMSTKTICVTSVEGWTGFTIAQALTTCKEPSFNVLGISQNPDKVDPSIRTVPFGEADAMASHLSNVDCMILVPPAGHNKVEVARRMIKACKDANVKHVLVVSSIYPQGDKDIEHKYPCLNEFRMMEQMATDSGIHDLCIVRLAFYMENLMLYRANMEGEHILPVPLRAHDKLSPISLQDAALAITKLCALCCKNDKWQSDVVTLVGHQTCTPPEMARAASKAWGSKIEYKQITDGQALQILSTTSIDPHERAVLLELYRMVREGKEEAEAKDKKGELVNLLKSEQPPTTLEAALKMLKTAA
jgi:uncharacterized protein YbjT (DUF2867 family)